MFRLSAMIASREFGSLGLIFDSKGSSGDADKNLFKDRDAVARFRLKKPSKCFRLVVTK